MEHHEPDSEDPLSIARGVMSGCLLAVIVWLLIVGIAVFLYQGKATNETDKQQTPKANERG